MIPSVPRLAQSRTKLSAFNVAETLSAFDHLPILDDAAGKDMFEVRKSLLLDRSILLQSFDPDVWKSPCALSLSSKNFQIVKNGLVVRRHAITQKSYGTLPGGMVVPPSVSAAPLDAFIRANPGSRCEF